jgi:tetratricopeptide (TPR) repeat protein
MIRLRAAVVLLVLGASSSAAAQIPEKFENLKVLPRDIPRAQLINTMRGFTFALAVRCQYCHVFKDGTSPDDLNNFTFKLDDKPTKDKARLMLRMVATINDSILPKLASRADPGVRVDCVTCHRGLPLPRTLDAILAQTINKQGVDSAVVQYKNLREGFMPLGRYNFGEGTLSELVRQLVADGEPAAALRMLELNQEYYPASAGIDYQMAEIHRLRGERDHAIGRYKKALEKMPNHAQARQRLQELGE